MAWTLRQIFDTLIEDYDFDEDDAQEVVDNIEDKDSDFEVNDYRFIRERDIDEIQKDELSSDEYDFGDYIGFRLN